MAEIYTLSFHELTPTHLRAWREIRSDDRSLRSPFFHPEFARATEKICGNVEVAVIDEAGIPVGFFPYQRVSKHAAVPLGGDLSDLHGVVTVSTDWTPNDLIRACGLRRWHFNHLIATQECFAPFHSVRAQAPYIEISKGFAVYVEEIKNRGARTVQAIQRKARKLGREKGPLRLEFQETDSTAFARMIDWKTAQYRRMKVKNYLSSAWATDFLEHLLTYNDPDFTGTLSTLYARDQPVATLYGLRSGETLHSWFPAYDAQVGTYSPGLILFFELARRAEDLGIRYIDLGKGDERYKSSLMTGSVLVAEGAVDLEWATRFHRHAWLRARDWVRASAMYGPTKVVIRNARNWLQRVCVRGSPRTKTHRTSGP